MSNDDYFWELDLDAVCRICLEDSDEEMTSILKSCGDDENASILEQIERCSGIKLANDPLLPSRICYNCKTFLKVAQKFRIICKRSNDYLREFVYNPETEIIEESESETPFEEYLVDDNAETVVYPLNEKVNAQQNLDATIPPEEDIVDEEDGDTDDVIEHDYREEEESYDSNHCGNDNRTTTDEKFTEIWLNDNANEVYEENLEEIEADEVDGDVEDVEIEQKRQHEIKVNITKSLEIASDGSAVLRTKTNDRPAKNSEKKYSHTCEVCGNSYPRKFALEAHMRRHRNERPFECEICHAAFHLNFQLKRHMRKHTGDRPYKCQYCERTFADRSSVVKHERTHRNERPYQCETCSKRFTYSSVLKVHHLTHTGEKPYKCEICHKRFARNHHLRAHLETQLHSTDPRATELLKGLNAKEYND